MYNMLKRSCIRFAICAASCGKQCRMTFPLQVFHHWIRPHLQRSASLRGTCPVLGPRFALSDTLTDSALSQSATLFASLAGTLASDWLPRAEPCHPEPKRCQPGRHDSWRRATRRIDENKPPSHKHKRPVGWK